MPQGIRPPVLHPTSLLVSATSGQSSRSPAQGPQGTCPPPPACYLSSSPTLALTPGAGGGDPKVPGDGSHNPGCSRGDPAGTT
ncbi:U1 small nuclear ribonucleoprotein C-like [Leopardus geoffroyi]|uniref:U1 small nuclear ribonucleoprotein C-like n=1 Tax=Leopardus geoffroyi TaxID=46844 RepID=UPI001E25EE42|nr:U1 small nuclear ribonucleoprotein C-like [Leopardus geoffroyi]